MSMNSLLTDDMESSNLFEAMKTRRNQRLSEFQDDDTGESNTSIPVLDSPKKQVTDDQIEETQVRSESAASNTFAQSMRERMRNRVKSAASATPTSDSKLPLRKLRGLRNRELPNRFEENTAKPPFEEELDPHLQQSLATTKEWKRMKMEQNKKYGVATDEEAFQFFTGSLDEEDNEETVIEHVTTPDLSTFAVDIDDSILIYNAKPEYVSHHEQLIIEEKLYHYPSVLPAPQESKVPDGCIPRNLADEGFYIGQPPKVPKATLNKMENRLLNDVTWFDEDGRLDSLPDPLKKQFTRKVLLEDFELDPNLKLDWLKAQRSSNDSRYIDEQGIQHYQIDVDISTIRFTHQSLFSKEHLLESRLVELYNHLISRKKSGFQQHISSKFEALRISLQQLQRSFNEDNQTEEQKRRVINLQLEIRQIRKQKYDAEFAERSLLMNILKTWQSLKKLREIQGYINTTSVIKVRKELSNKHDDHLHLKEEINEEIDEERVAFTEAHMEEFKNYEKSLLKWKKYQRLKKRQSQMNNVNDDNEGKEIPAVQRPVRPIQFNEEEVLQIIKERNATRRRKPGEAILIPELHSSAVVTPTEQCPREEQLRRNAMKNVSYFVKILFNDVEVSRTSTKFMSSDFTVTFGEILSMKILQWPESIRLQICSGSPIIVLAEVFAPLPMAASNNETSFDELEFSCDHVVQYRHEGVGSGLAVHFNLENVTGETIIPLTSGVLYIKTNWGKDENGQVLAPKNSADDNTYNSMMATRHHDALAALGAAGMVDIHKLLTWLGKAKLDPNDPTNADIVALARMAQMSQLDNLAGPKYFRLNQLEKEADFATEEDLTNNKRLQLIKLRDEGVQEFKNVQMIPVNEKFISSEVFEAYEKRKNYEDDVGEQEDEYTQRKAVLKFLTKVREQVHMRTQLAKRQLDFEDVIVEEAIPDIGTLGARIAQIMEPRRPLKPARKERKKIGGQNLNAVKDVKLLINIVRAFDIPIRAEVTQQNVPQVPSSAGVNQGYNPTTTEIKSMVRPFVEVMFQGTFLRTSVAEGAWPNWNEDLSVPFKAPNNDYSTDNLQMISDKIFINIFDEVIVDMLVDERLRETNVHQRIEKRWLGSIEIPFSTVYLNSKVEGFLEVNTPSILLGYKNARSQNDTFSLKKEKTLLQMFITIEPQLQTPPSMPEKFETSEDDTLIHNAQIWLSDLRQKYSQREYKALVSDLDGKKVFLTRYIHSQQPPNELILNAEVSDQQKMKLLARFVSLIPYVADSAQFPDICDIWTNSGQFLQMLAGDEEEHAVLLCNYFIWLGLDAYVVLGRGIPEGSTAYVFTIVGSSYQLWNASTGMNYEISNVHCPLQSIGCLIKENNIYANIQSEELPSKMNFNLANTKYWKSFFTKSYVYPGLASVQTEQPTYFPIDNQQASNQQDKLERTLRTKLMEWRPTQITKFNRYCSQAFKNLLKSMESQIVLNSPPTDYKADLEQVLQSHRVTGFPLHMPYTDQTAIVERVYSTGIHQTEEADIEFALAVHLHPYPNSVFAVWIYVGRLTRKT